ncbi:MAG: hypothetical protein INR63_19970 [Actinomycetospora chiangmaiensis]|jgi:hypothetical protein|nr:hypothetical protein [Actinomycetospora chiangmaiensis]
MTRIFLVSALSLAIIAPAAAQTVDRPVAPGPGAPGVVTQQPNSTGNDPAVTYSPTGRPADTLSTDSAAAGNAGQPSRVAPQGSGGSGGK